jgi:hypothetical protein
MDFKFQPLGIPASRSHTLYAPSADTVQNAPESASFAQFTEFPVGPQGPCASIITGSIIPIL